MANKVQVLDKIQRNCEQLSIATTRSDADTLVVSGITITYVDADIQKPMGGIDDQTNPFLGIGVGNPGRIKLSASIDSADAAALSDLLVDGEDAQVFHIIAGMANTKELEVLNAGAGADFQATILGHQDLLGMGQ